VPFVVSVHDVSYLEEPRYFKPVPRGAASFDCERYVQTAERDSRPSEFSRGAILKHYSLDEHKVVVVPNAVSRDIAR